MQIHIMAVGKIKEPFFRDGIAEYEKRLRPYVRMQITEIPEEKRPAGSPVAESGALEKEGDRILGVLPPDSVVVALDRTGKTWSSEELASWIGSREIAGQSRIVFVIGGDLGLSPAVIERSTMHLSLSPMTFTHPMARLLLVEQIYRAYRILRGEPYHK